MEHRYTPFSIERGKIREFALALGLTDSIYFEVETAMKKGYRDIPAPPTFSTVIDFWNREPYYDFFDSLGLDPKEVLHGEQSYYFFEDMCAGDVVTGNVRVKEVISKKNKDFYSIETSYINQHHQKVRASVATLIHLQPEGFK